MKTPLFLAVLFGLWMCACSTSDRSKLETAAQLVHHRPDSAYILLREINYNGLDADSLKARYILTRAIANLRVGRSLITDTLLNDAATYYISVGDTTDWVLSSQLLSGYDFISGNPEAALGRLTSMLPRIESPELLWDTHIHLLEMSMNSQCYENARTYADWLLNHTDRPEHRLKFAAVKGAALYMDGRHTEALEAYDRAIAEGIVDEVSPQVASEFYREYTEILDGAGRSREAIAILDRLGPEEGQQGSVRRVKRLLTAAQFNANLGNPAVARQLLDSINIDGTQSVFEIYASLAMLRAAVEYRLTGHFPSDFMHRVTKTMQRNFELSQYDRQTALESVIELSEDKAELQLQKQRLYLLIFGIVLAVAIGTVIVYIILSRRKQRLVEAAERIEALDRMIREAETSEPDDRETALRRLVLRQMGILKSFASTPTAQSEDALRKISNIGRTEPNPQLVDWNTYYTMVDELYDGFHSRLLARYPGLFTDREIQLISLLRADFSTKEISFLTGQSSASVYVRKTAIRKKLHTPENGDFMAQIEEETMAV